MKKTRILFLLTFVLTITGLAGAQATRTWVSGVGDDVNPCSRTAPCKTFAGAISKTAKDGEINCLDPAGYGVVTITKSIVIDCSFTGGGILSAGTNGIVINITDPADVRKQVRLHGLDINGAGTGLDGIRVLGANGVDIDDVSVENVTGDALEVAGTSLVTVEKSKFRVASNGINASGSTGLQITNTYISFCNIGVLSQSSAIVGLQASTVLLNNTGLSVSSGGQIWSYGNNVIDGNQTNGAPTMLLPFK